MKVEIKKSAYKDDNDRYRKLHIRIADETIIPILIPEKAGLMHLGYLAHHIKKNGATSDLVQSMMKEFNDLEAMEAIRIISLFVLYEKNKNTSMTSTISPEIFNIMYRK